MNVFASKKRPKLLKKLANTTYDLLVIGGGATGSGIALDAASRGLSTALIDKQDFAAGTSSRSTKLIHGGLRYLKQFEIALVREVGRERAIVHKLAPHLVVSEKMLLPLIKGGTYGKLATSLGLMVYDVLAGVESADQRVMLSKEKTQELEPLLNEELLEGSGFYAEYRTDDARLSLEVLKTAALYGAHSINYVEAKDFIYEDKMVCGANCTDLLSGKTFEIKARQVVNAAGPWVDELREKNNSLEGKHLFLSKGVHIVLPHEKFPIKNSIYFDVPDGRMLFAIPRGKITYLGTTDTPYKGNKENPRTYKEDVEYLIHGLTHVFPSIQLKVEDVISSWAGLRPLIHEEGKSASEISRKDEIFISDTNLVSIAGGKLTGYRKMAERVVDEVADRLKRKYEIKSKKCKTHKIIISGGGYSSDDEVKSYIEKINDRLESYNFDVYVADYLVHNYGKQTDRIIDHFVDQEDHTAFGLMAAELWYGLNFEMVNAAMDFFSRRTGRLYFNIQSIKDHKGALLALMKDHLAWSEERYQQELKWVDQAVEEASHFPPEPQTT